MYTEQSVIDKVEILENGTIQVRRADRVFKDGIKIAETFHRHVVSPDQDITNEDNRIKQVAQLIWTDKVKGEYKALKDKLNAKG